MFPPAAEMALVVFFGNGPRKAAIKEKAGEEIRWTGNKNMFKIFFFSGLLHPVF